MTPFEKAFAAARKSGKKTFEHNGKSYTTALRDDKAAKTAPKPKGKPGGQKRTGYQPGAGPKRDRTPPSQDEIAKSTGTQGRTARSMPKSASSSSTAPKSRAGVSPTKTPPSSARLGSAQAVEGMQGIARRAKDAFDSVSKQPGAKRITAAADKVGRTVIAATKGRKSPGRGPSERRRTSKSEDK